MASDKTKGLERRNASGSMKNLQQSQRKFPIFLSQRRMGRRERNSRDVKRMKVLCEINTTV